MRTRCQLSIYLNRKWIWIFSRLCLCVTLLRIWHISRKAPYFWGHFTVIFCFTKQFILSLIHTAYVRKCMLFVSELIYVCLCNVLYYTCSRCLLHIRFCTHFWEYVLKNICLLCGCICLLVWDNLSISVLCNINVCSCVSCMLTHI